MVLPGLDPGSGGQNGDDTTQDEEDDDSSGGGSASDAVDDYVGDDSGDAASDYDPPSQPDDDDSGGGGGSASDAVDDYVGDDSDGSDAASDYDPPSQPDDDDSDGGGSAMDAVDEFTGGGSGDAASDYDPPTQPGDDDPSGGGSAMDAVDEFTGGEPEPPARPPTDYDPGGDPGSPPAVIDLYFDRGGEQGLPPGLEDEENVEDQFGDDPFAGPGLLDAPDRIEEIDDEYRFEDTTAEEFVEGQRADLLEAGYEPGEFGIFFSEDEGLYTDVDEEEVADRLAEENREAGFAEDEFSIRFDEEEGFSTEYDEELIEARARDEFREDIERAYTGPDTDDPTAVDDAMAGLTPGEIELGERIDEEGLTDEDIRTTDEGGIELDPDSALLDRGPTPTEVDDATARDTPATPFVLDPTQQRDVEATQEAAAEQLSEQYGTDVAREDIFVGAQGPELSPVAQERIQREQVAEQLGIDPADIEGIEYEMVGDSPPARTGLDPGLGGGREVLSPELTPDAEMDLIAEQDPDIDRDELTRDPETGEVGLTQAAERERIAEREGVDADALEYDAESGQYIIEGDPQVQRESEGLVSSAVGVFGDVLGAHPVYGTVVGDEEVSSLQEMTTGVEEFVVGQGDRAVARGDQFSQDLRGGAGDVLGDAMELLPDAVESDLAEGVSGGPGPGPGVGDADREYDTQTPEASPPETPVGPGAAPVDGQDPVVSGSDIADIAGDAYSTFRGLGDDEYLTGTPPAVGPGGAGQAVSRAPGVVSRATRYIDAAVDVATDTRNIVAGAGVLGGYAIGSQQDGTQEETAPEQVVYDRPEIDIPDTAIGRGTGEIPVSEETVGRGDPEIGVPDDAVASGVSEISVPEDEVAYDREEVAVPDTTEQTDPTQVRTAELVDPETVVDEPEQDRDELGPTIEREIIVVPELAEEVVVREERDDGVREILYIPAAGQGSVLGQPQRDVYDPEIGRETVEQPSVDIMEQQQVFEQTRDAELLDTWPDVATGQAPGTAVTATDTQQMDSESILELDYASSPIVGTEPMGTDALAQDAAVAQESVQTAGTELQTVQDTALDQLAVRPPGFDYPAAPQPGIGTAAMTPTVVQTGPPTTTPPFRTPIPWPDPDDGADDDLVVPFGGLSLDGMSTIAAGWATETFAGFAGIDAAGRDVIEDDEELFGEFGIELDEEEEAALGDVEEMLGF